MSLRSSIHKWKKKSFLSWKIVPYSKLSLKMIRSCMPSFKMTISSWSLSYLSLKIIEKIFWILRSLYYHRLSCLKKSFKKSLSFWKFRKEEMMILRSNFKSLKDKELKALKNSQLVANSEMKLAKVEKKLKNHIMEKCQNTLNLIMITPISQNKIIISRIFKIKITTPIISKKIKRNGTVKEMENLKIGEKKINIQKTTKGLP